jgi:hypothetical protein
MVNFRFGLISCAVLFILCGIWGFSESGSGDGEQYAVVIDAGSTGTRAFVFKIDIDQDQQRTIHSYSCGKERRGLSSFSSNPSDANDMFTNLLNKALELVPEHLHSQTSLYVKGTAGMRLLPEYDQEVLWDTLVNDLQLRSDIKFNIVREHFGTITGHQEAFYAVLASNYIVGSIDGQLSVTDDIFGSFILNFRCSYKLICLTLSFICTTFAGWLKAVLLLVLWIWVAALTS